MPPELEKKLDEMVEANIKQWVEDRQRANQEAFARAFESCIED